MMPSIQITAARKAELEAEFLLRTTKMRTEIRSQVEEARAHGDLKENSEYEAARNEQNKNESRIQEIESIIKYAEIVESSHTGFIDIASCVELKKVADGSTKNYCLVGPAEADISTGKLSAESAIGQALIGKKKGDIVSVTTPVGVQEYEIISVE
jgi:transcription elongation factor GreA